VLVALAGGRLPLAWGEGGIWVVAGSVCASLLGQGAVALAWWLARPAGP